MALSVHGLTICLISQGNQFETSNGLDEIEILTAQTNKESEYNCPKDDNRASEYNCPKDDNRAYFAMKINDILSIRPQPPVIRLKQADSCILTLQLFTFDPYASENLRELSFKAASLHHCITLNMQYATPQRGQGWRGLAEGLWLTEVRVCSRISCRIILIGSITSTEEI